MTAGLFQLSGSFASAYPCPACGHFERFAASLRCVYCTTIYNEISGAQMELEEKRAASQPTDEPPPRAA